MKLIHLKNSFRGFYGELPIDELTLNSSLIISIKRIEVLLSKLCLSSTESSRLNRINTATEIKEEFLCIWKNFDPNTKKNISRQQYFIVLLNEISKIKQHLVNSTTSTKDI